MKYNKLRTSFALLCVFLVATVLTAYAWFLTAWDSNRAYLGFSAGTVPAPEASMWLYSTAFDAEEDPTAQEGWVEHRLTADEDDSDAFKIPGVSATQNDGKYSFALSSLHLGTIDNLVILASDNVVCLRFAFNSELHGNAAAQLSVAFNDSLGMIHLYDSEGNELTDTTIKSDLEDINSATPFLQYQACISGDRLSPSDTEFESLAFCDAVPFGTSLDLYSGTEPIDGDYYVYIKIMPSLDAFAPTSELLNKYMPCIILFDTEIKLTVY